MTREKGWELAQKYDGKRPASLDNFLSILDMTEDDFEKMLLNNAVIDWGFDRSKIETGPVLHDMKDWDKLD